MITVITAIIIVIIVSNSIVHCYASKDIKSYTEMLKSDVDKLETHGHLFELTFHSNHNDH